MCFLVAPRGRTQWVRNAEAAGQVGLRGVGTPKIPHSDRFG
jgi:hypothetical protein